MNNIETLATQILSTIIILAYLKVLFNKVMYHIDKRTDDIKDNLIVKIDSEKLKSLSGNHKGDAGRRF